MEHFILILTRNDGASSILYLEGTEEVVDKTIYNLLNKMPEVVEVIKTKLIETIQRTPPE